MYKSKITPEESLELIKVRMKYDTKKTLRENINKKVIISEQEKSNMVTDADLLGSTNLIRQYYQLVSDYTVLFDPFGVNPLNVIAGRRAGVKGVVDALDGWVDMKDLAFVLQTIKSLAGKCYYDEIEGKNISATQAFLDLYQEDEGEDIKSDVESVGTKTLPTGAEKVKKLIIKTIDTQIAQGCSTQKNPEEKKSDSDKSNGKKQQSVKVPSELATAEGIKHFQDWLDTNHKGWASGYKDGIINKGKNGGGYGTFGPRTSKAWNTHKTDYLSGKTKPEPAPEDKEVSDVNSENY